jgi:Beta-propeller repeat
MLHTHHLAHYFKYLLALTLALVGLTGGPTLPRASAGQRSLRDCTDQAHFAHLPRQGTSVSSLMLPEEATQARVQAAYGTLPLSFEANQGQTAPQVQFLARGRGYSLFLTTEEAVLAFSQLADHDTALGADTAAGGRADAASRSQRYTTRGRAPIPPQAVVRMQLVGANATPPGVGHDALPGKSHYLIGNDPQDWRTDIAHYATVKYAGVYPGVDLFYYGHQGQLEYDFVVSAGADPRAITLAFVGASAVHLDAGGELVLSVGGGEMRQRKPVIYQEVDGVRQGIVGGYRLEGHHVSFAVGEYDVSRPLVIDPVLIYSTYLGGNGSDSSRSIAVDKDGQAYVTGTTASSNFPTTAGAFQPTFAGADAFVTKLNCSGTALVYSTYLGGSDFDAGVDIAVDKDGQVYVAGGTWSRNFPTTAGAFQRTHAGGISDAFVTKLDRSGTALVYSTYLGGRDSEASTGIAVDKDGQAYVVGVTESRNFPTAAGAFQPTYAGGSVDTFVTKLNRSGTALVYSTYLGGSSDDLGVGIAVDKDGQVYMAGGTSSSDFPTTRHAFQPAHAGGIADSSDAFVTKLNRSGTALVYSTYLGGSNSDMGNGIAVDEDGRAYVTGGTASSDFPTTRRTVQPAFAGGIFDAFVTKLNRNGTALVYSTYLGGSDREIGIDIAVDEDGRAYVTGRTESPDFPTTRRAFQPAFAGGIDVFVTKLNRSGTALVYSTYLGGSGDDGGDGIAVDEDGQAYITGPTTSSDFPTTRRAVQPAFAGGFEDAFVVKIGDHDDDHDDDND